jgi:hypothetical protein
VKGPDGFSVSIPNPVMLRVAMGVRGAGLPALYPFRCRFRRAARIARRPGGFPLADRLLDVEAKRKPRWTGSLAIVLLARDKCLRCAGNVIEYAYGQLPLFRSHGHGAVEQTTLMVCMECDWNYVSDVTEVNPRRYGVK